MTPEQRKQAERVKTKIAQSKGYPTWDEMENWIIDHNGVQDAVLVMMSAMNEVLEEYNNLSCIEITEEEIEEQVKIITKSPWIDLEILKGFKEGISFYKTLIDKKYNQK